MHKRHAQVKYKEEYHFLVYRWIPTLLNILSPLLAAIIVTSQSLSNYCTMCICGFRINTMWLFHFLVLSMQYWHQKQLAPAYLRAHWSEKMNICMIIRAKSKFLFWTCEAKTVCECCLFALSVEKRSKIAQLQCTYVRACSKIMTCLQTNYILSWFSNVSKRECTYIKIAGEGSYTDLLISPFAGWQHKAAHWLLIQQHSGKWCQMACLIISGAAFTPLKMASLTVYDPK